MWWIMSLCWIITTGTTVGFWRCLSVRLTAGEMGSRILDDVMTSLLPEDAQDEIPVGFAIVGHVGMHIFPSPLFRRNAD